MPYGARTALKAPGRHVSLPVFVGFLKNGLTSATLNIFTKTWYQINLRHTNYLSRPNLHVKVTDIVPKIKWKRVLASILASLLVFYGHAQNNYSNLSADNVIEESTNSLVLPATIGLSKYGRVWKI